jgi:hypothetical protein
MSLPAITSGTLYAYRLFEVAEEVDLAVLGRFELPASITIRPGRLSFFGRLRGLFSVAALGLSDVELEPGRWVQAETTVLVFSFGVAAACFQIPIGNATAAQAVGATLSPADAARLVALLNGSPALTQSGQKAVERLLQLIGPARAKPRPLPILAHQRAPRLRRDARRMAASIPSIVATATPPQIRPTRAGPHGEDRRNAIARVPPLRTSARGSNDRGAARSSCGFSARVSVPGPPRTHRHD